MYLFRPIDQGFFLGQQVGVNGQQLKLLFNEAILTNGLRLLGNKWPIHKFQFLTYWPSNRKSQKYRHHLVIVNLLPLVLAVIALSPSIISFYFVVHSQSLSHTSSSSSFISTVSVSESVLVAFGFAILILAVIYHFCWLHSHDLNMKSRCGPLSPALLPPILSCWIRFHGWARAGGGLVMVGRKPRK